MTKKRIERKKKNNRVLKYKKKMIIMGKKYEGKRTMTFKKIKECRKEGPPSRPEYNWQNGMHLYLCIYISEVMTQFYFNGGYQTYNVC